MIAYAEKTNSRLLHSTRGDVPDLTAMRTQLDSIILRHEVVEEGEESELPPRSIGDLDLLKNRPVRNIAITSGCYVSSLEAGGTLRSTIYTANLHPSIRIFYDIRLSKVIVLVSSDAKERFFYLRKDLASSPIYKQLSFWTVTRFYNSKI